MPTNKPEHLVWCERCRHYTIVFAYPSEVCSSRCGGCVNGLHCNSCTKRGIKTFERGGHLVGRTRVMIDEVSRNIVGADGQSVHIRDIPHLRRELKSMSERRSEQLGYDVRYNTEWGD